MARFKADDHAGDGSGSGPWPNGRYLSQVVGIERLYGKSSGKPYVKITNSVIGPGGQRRRVFDNHSLQEHALWKFASFVQAIGQGGTEFDIDDESAIRRVCLERWCAVQLASERGQDGKDWNKVEEYMVCSDEERAKIARGDIESAAPSPGSNGSDSPPADNEWADDDIPF